MFNKLIVSLLYLVNLFMISLGVQGRKELPARSILIYIIFDNHVLYTVDTVTPRQILGGRSLR